MEIPEPVRLGDLLEGLRRESLEGWVLVKGQTMLNVDMPAIVMSLDDDDEVAKLEGSGWRVTIDADTAMSMVNWTDDLEGAHGEATAELLVKSFEYYVEMDSPMPSLDAEIERDPRVLAESWLKYLRGVYESFGEERKDVRCRVEGCGRGAVEHSVCCRIHHYEQVQGQTCPFSD